MHFEDKIYTIKKDKSLMQCRYLYYI